MNIMQFNKKIATLKDRLGVVNVKPGEKFLGQFTFGYYKEELGEYIIYEVTERQRLIIWKKVNNEELALDELFDLIKFCLGIRN